jgi:hypothetical protein
LLHANLSFRCLDQIFVVFRSSILDIATAL